MFAMHFKSVGLARLSPRGISVFIIPILLSIQGASLAQQQGPAHESFDAAAEMAAKNAIIQTRKQNDDYQLSREGWPQWGGQFAKSLVPGWNEYDIAQATPNAVSNILQPGNRLQEEAQSLWALPFSQFNARLDAMLEPLNAMERSQVLEYLSDFSGSTKTMMNVKAIWYPLLFLFAATTIYLRARRRSLAFAENGMSSSPNFALSPPTDTIRETTIIGRDADMLIKMAVLTASETIADQKEAAEKNMQKQCSVDAATRFAVDDFVVGYVAGLTANLVKLNGRRASDMPMDQVLADLQTRLNQSFPGIEVASTYRGLSQRVTCGWLLGIHEPTFSGEYKSLEQVLNLMSSHQLAPDTYMQQWVHNNLRVTSEEFDQIGVAVREMHSRYCSMLR
jgi:hypothetical protein